MSEASSLSGSPAHDSSPGLGHNQPPKNLREEITERYKQELSRLAELKASCATVPNVVGDDETAGKVGDLLKLIRVAIKAADGARSEEKEPFLKAGQEVDAIFKVPIDALKKDAEPVQERLTQFLEKKKQAEALAREKKAAEERAKAEAAAREKALAEERTRQAAEAAEEAEQRRKEAADNTDEAEQRRLNAEASLATAKAARAVAKRDKDEAALALAEEAYANAGTELAAAKDELRKRRTEEREAKEAADRKARDEAEADRKRKAAAADAQRTEGQATRAEKRADAGVADLSRTRSVDLGSVSSLAKRWTFVISDRTKIPAASLWPYFTEDEIKLAVSRAVHGGLRELAGVRIFQENDTRIT